MTYLSAKSVPGFLAMCFGFCLRKDYAPVPAKEPTEPKPRPAQQPATSKKPVTDWKDIPLVASYNLIKQIGKGGFATIWQAESKATQQTVAIKVVQLTDPDLEPEEVATLLAEARFLRSLDCPYIIKYIDAAANEEWLILVLEYLSGGEMLDHIHKVKKYTEAEAASLFAQVVSAISYLHNLNLMHRDIKPENVMFASRVEDCEAEGRPLRVKVIDLGMSTLYDPKKEIRGCVGTPGFVAPELWNDKPHTLAGDVYALGVVLFIMLTGRKPHSGADIRLMTYCNKSINDAPGLKDERFLALSPAARELLLSMLADDPQDRPTCSAVLRHPFITAVDSNADAHREMGEEVRRRMRDLNRIRRVHGLRYALRINKPHGADHQAFLELLDRRRLRLKREVGGFNRMSDAQAAFERPSYASDTSAKGAIAPNFAKCSLTASYAVPPAVIMPPGRSGAAQPPSGTASASPRSTAATPRLSVRGSTSGATGSNATPTPLSPPQPPRQPAPAPAQSSPFVSPFASLSHGPLGAAAADTQPGAGRGALPPIAAVPRISRASAPGHGMALNATSNRAVSSPYACSHDMGLPVQDALAARPAGAGPLGAQHPVAAPHLGSELRPLPLPSLDPMALVNVLPTMEHCMSVGGLHLSEDGEGRPGGGSPVATKAMVDQALMATCMSANPYTLELLARRDSIQPLLEQVAAERREVSSLAATVPGTASMIKE